MIDRYLEKSEMYVLMINGQAASVAVVGQVDEQLCELHNLATAPGMRGQGYATKLVRHLIRLYQPRCKRMLVGTSKELMPFYERFGFKYSFTREGFFLDEGYAGVQFDEEDLKDMQVLEVEL